MLQEGRQARDEGRDVVIGYLEPHDRPETAALAEGLEQVPRLRSSHGGLELEEMDVDAVIRREPELALVDELAHTNVPEARNRKRYEDIDELLDAGDRRHLDRQRPAPREPQRLDLRAHRACASARRSPTTSSTTPTRSCSSTSRPRRCRSGCSPARSIRADRVETALAELLPHRQPRGAARARAARAGRGRRGEAAHDGARPAQPAGRRRADPRARDAGAALAARAAARVPLGRHGSAPRSTSLWMRRPGAELDRAGGRLARRAAAAREHARRALPRARGRRPRRRS